MATERTRSRFSRRTYLGKAAAVGTLGTVVLAGCLDDDDPEDPAAPDDDDDAIDDDVEDDDDEEPPEDDDVEDDDDVDDDAPEAGSFEIIHWWTAGGEEQALNALLEGFLGEYGYDEEIIDNNPAPGGAGAAIDAEIQTRVIDEDPPSTFQIWPGESLRPYTDADVLADIGDIWDDEMQEAYVDDVIELARPADQLVSVPINIHRMNNMFYNVGVLEDAGIDPAEVTDVDGLLEGLDALEDAGYVPLAHQTSTEWSTLQLWESLFIAQHGVEAYNTFLDREMDGIAEEIEATLELVVAASEYFSPDASAIAWDEANAQVINGEAAVIHQGDWAAGQYGEAEGFEYETDWDYIPVPGTEEVYQVVIDSFVMPEPNPSPDLTQEFLTYCGSIDAQERFNPIKGSIPPRTDVPVEDFPPFLRDQMDDFEASTAQPPTVAHGSGFDPQGKSQLEEIFAAFIEDWDASSAADRIVQEL